MDIHRVSFRKIQRQNCLQCGTTENCCFNLSIELENLVWKKGLYSETLKSLTRGSYRLRKVNISLEIEDQAVPKLNAELLYSCDLLSTVQDSVYPFAPSSASEKAWLKRSDVMLTSWNINCLLIVFRKLQNFLEGCSVQFQILINKKNYNILETSTLGVDSL